MLEPTRTWGLACLPVRKMEKMSNLYRYQKQAIREGLDHDARFGLFMDMGTGKTRVTIETASHIRTCRRILVVAPLSGAGVWRKEVRKWAPGARTLTCTEHAIKERAARVRRLGERPRRVYVLVGYESFWREPLRSAILKWQPDMVVYDEAHRLKSWRTRQSKFAHSMAVPDNKIHTPAYILPLTGTPAPNGPEDMFSIFKAFAPEVFGTRWTDFEARYIVKGGYMGYQIMGYRNQEELQEKIAAHSFRITKAEALDLPPEVDVPVPFRLSSKGRRIYDKMAKEAIAMIDGIQGTGTALGRIVLSQETRLQQIVSGFVRVEEKGKKLIDFDSSRRSTLKDLLQDILLQEDKVVIFCRFRRDVDAAIKVAQKLKARTFQLDGRIKSQRKRDWIVKDFSQPDFTRSRVLVAQIQVASVSIDLSAAHIGIFYSRNWSYLNYDQARSRLHRHGQTSKVTYYHILAEDTIDEKIQKALANKEEVQRTLLRDKKKARRFFSTKKG